MARKISNVARLTRSVAKRKKRAKAATSNPGAIGSIVDDVTTVILPGVAAYALGRLSGRIAYRLARKRSLKLARHAGALVPSATALIAYVATAKVDKAQDYQMPVMVGTGIAAAQSFAQAYFPQWSWILNDYHMDDVLPRQQLAQPSAAAALPAHKESLSIAQPPTADTANVDASGTVDLSDIGSGLGADDDFLDQLESQAPGGQSNVLPFSA
jgi:hypothetical protein